MHRHFANICSRITRFLPMPRNDQRLPANAMLNSCQLVQYSLINSRNWIHVTCDVTLRVNMTHLTLEDRLLIDFADRKRLDFLKMIVEFPSRQWKRHVVWSCTNNWVYWLC